MPLLHNTATCACLQNFLVQGILEAPGVYVATPRHPNPPQRSVMERGLVCWAGGGGGPHWFVNMVRDAESQLLYADIVTGALATAAQSGCSGSAAHPWLHGS